MKRCSQPGCHLAGDDIGTCGNAGGPIPCGVPVDVKPAADVVLHCKPCGKTWAVNVPGSLMKRGQSLPRCAGSTDRCRAVIVPQEKAAK
jgi:hypothetical protein